MNQGGDAGLVFARWTDGYDGRTLYCIATFNILPFRTIPDIVPPAVFLPDLLLRFPGVQAPQFSGVLQCYPVVDDIEVYRSCRFAFNHDPVPAG
jgi:hypothetical protein